MTEPRTTAPSAIERLVSDNNLELTLHIGSIDVGQALPVDPVLLEMITFAREHRVDFKVHLSALRDGFTAISNDDRGALCGGWSDRDGHGQSLVENALEGSNQLAVVWSRFRSNALGAIAIRNDRNVAIAARAQEREERRATQPAEGPGAARRPSRVRRG